MAKMQGITGKLSGKMGSAVFRVREGQQIVSQYNPIVQDPNTEAQQSNKASFKLMTQLAAIMSPALGAYKLTSKAGKGKGSQRNEFVKLNYPLVTTSEQDGSITAKIEMDQLDLTGSYKAFGQMSLQQSADALNVRISNISDGTKKGKVVLVGFGSLATADRPARAAVMEVVEVPVINGEINYSFPMQPNRATDNYTVLAYGLIPSTSAASRIDLDNIHTPADEEFISAVKLDYMVSAGEMSVTETIGENISLS